MHTKPIGMNRTVFKSVSRLFKQWTEAPRPFLHLPASRSSVETCNADSLRWRQYPLRRFRS